MFRKGLIKDYAQRLRVWALSHRITTVGILSMILISSWTWVLSRKNDNIYNVYETVYTISKSKAEKTLDLSNSFQKLGEGFYMMSEINRLKNLDSLSANDSLKVDEIIETMLKK